MDIKKLINVSWSIKYNTTCPGDIIGLGAQTASIGSWLDEYYNECEGKSKTLKKRKKKLIVETIVKEPNEFVEGEDDSETIIPDTGKIDSNSTDQSCLLLIGNHGVGKTTTIHTILKQKNYIIKNIDISKIDLTNNIDDYTDKLMNGLHIFNHLVGVSSKKYAIIVDEIESLVYPAEKNFVLNLIKKNDIIRKCPIIFIANNKHNKFISTVKNNCKTVYFNQPTNNNLKELLFKICANEKIGLENEATADKIILHSQNDYRRLLFIVQDLYINYDKNISEEYIDEYSELSKKKDTDVDIYKAVANMISNYKNIDECIRYYEGEKVIIPLLFHQNYIKYICMFSHNTKTLSNYKLLSDISLSFAKGDIVENYIYGDQIWDMQETHGYYTCVYPSYKLHNEQLNICEGVIKQNLDFPNDFNRTSIKNINKKNITNANFKLKNFEIKDFICLNHFVKYMIDNDSIEICANIFNSYDISIESIDSILKIDKMFDSKLSLPTHIKKKLVQLLNSSKIKNTKKIYQV